MRTHDLLLILVGVALLAMLWSVPACTYCQRAADDPKCAVVPQACRGPVAADGGPE